MTLTINEFFNDLKQELLSGAAVKEEFLEAEFAEFVARELQESGSIAGFDACYYKAVRAQRVDGYWFNDDEFSLDLFLVDFSNREKLETLTRTDVTSYTAHQKEPPHAHKK